VQTGICRNKRIPGMRKTE